ncbi:MAG TPA: hypothetical protein VLD64_06765 [Nitrosarchaeum sp.]|jgi:hypothetical protein|nr:hypothetical protein [Nitrosarchaeum sp.]
MKRSIISIVAGVVILLGILGFIFYSEPQISSNPIEPIKESPIPTGRNLSVNLSESLNMHTGP